MANTEGKKAKKPSFIKGVKTEYKKISWPDKSSLTKQTVAVVVVTGIMSVLIVLFDLLFKGGINWLTNLKF
ncbi:MAG: preprotein translocase subunit SecE [Lachnospiraceae bacterium]|jgi:preprotein translocase subunit SecE|nr:preprotein translocase subunit SecE [Lachnospiraceae bacterium]